MATTGKHFILNIVKQLSDFVASQSHSNRKGFHKLLKIAMSINLESTTETWKPQPFSLSETHTMELNRRKMKKIEKVINPEGSVVLARNPNIQLYLEASVLKIKTDSFYSTADEKLKGILELSKNTDEKYVLGLAKFLADKGIKLSPVVLLSTLADRKYSFRGENLNYIFNTPQRIAEPIALANLKLVSLNNSFYKNVLKPALENMNEHTLKKNKMKNRKVKLADLIKLLHAKPKDEKMKKLYKAIIENTKEASLKETENIVTVKSSTKLDEKEKKEIIERDLETLPINQLIRNLKFIADKYSFSKNIEMQKKINAKLKNVKDYRFLNIFDVITAMIHVPQMEKALFEVVEKFTSQVREEFDYPEKATLLFDVSGSMAGEGLEAGFKYLTLFACLIDKLNLRAFSSQLYGTSKDLDKVISKLKDGSVSDAKKIFDKYFNEHSHGTSLVEATTELLAEEQLKHLIVISDEVSWEEEDLTGNIKRLADLFHDTKLILINPVVYKGTVFKQNICAISSLNPSILLDIAILMDEQGFINHIRNYKVKNDTA